MRTLGAQFNYQFYTKSYFTAAAGAGFGLTRELFYLTDDNDPSLQSTDQADWNSPKLDLTGTFDFGTFNIGAGITGHYFFYNTEANWNLVEEFRHPVSFRQNAQGHGFDYRIITGIRPADFFGINLHFLHSNWKTAHGTDDLYMADGDVYQARLNGAFKKSFGLRLTTTFMF